MKKLLAFVALLMLAVTVSAQKEIKLNRAPGTVEVIHAAGVFTGTGYSNSALGFSITAPAGFKRVSDEANSAALQAGKAIVNEGKSAQKARDLDQSIAKTRVLFQYHAGGASLAAGVEQVPVGVTSRSYADANINILKSVNRAKLSKPVYERTLGGRAWQFFEVELDSGGGVISQLYMTRVDGQFALFIIASVGDPFLEDALIQSINSLKFN